MPTSTSEILEQVQATHVRFEGNVLFVTLSDGREISVPLDQVPWLGWLVRATPEQRANWSLEPRGFAIYWEELDDGIEVAHLLSTRPVS
ncbi:MAG: DUF2442 domain-containing protein [Chloroflexi bacterium]|nr:DUF2442 domain-containing protein [Chloroflexota bacterium]MCI0647896.1 DUF2442 domain-containing protein [Chloroflexota bacterium]MCI0727147.1 DUF2442 domain-containing protein [Chloroflexota bacterium]